MGTDVKGGSIGRIRRAESRGKTFNQVVTQEMKNNPKFYYDKITAIYITMCPQKIHYLDMNNMYTDNWNQFT